MHFACRSALTAALLLTAFPAVSVAPTWQPAPAPIDRILRATQPPTVLVSPDHRWIVELERPDMPSVAELAERVVRVAGIRINADTNGPAREYAYRSMAVRRLGPGESNAVELPEDARIRYTNWSPDSRRLTFTLTRPDGIELWVMDPGERKPRRLTPPVLNAAYGAPCEWLPGDEGLLCKIVGPDRGKPPSEAVVPEGPLVEESLGREAPARTYTNLLQSPHDEALFEYYLTSALDRVGLDGSRTRVLAPRILRSVEVSPDGRWILASTLHRPWSYHVPARRFPRKYEVLDATGRTVFEVADLPLADDVPIAFGSVRKGRRTVAFRPDQPATLYWVEALDEGDARKETDERDAVFTLAAPFDGPAKLLWKSEYRYGGLTWGREDLALASEWWWPTRKVRTWRIDPSDPAVKAQPIEDRNYQDAYADPGDPVLTPNRYGRWVLMFTPDGSSVYLTGRGASPEGVFPFLDRRNLNTGETERLWQSSAPYYERVIDLLDDKARRFITNRQSKEDPPNYFMRTRGKEEPVALTDHGDPAPELAGLGKERMEYERADGVKLSATLYLPPGYESSHGPLPTVVWAYPREHKSRDTAGQVTSSEYTFSRPGGSSSLLLLTQGYAVLSNPSIPIIGEGETEPNDTYVDQLVSGAEAAVDYLVKRGIADPQRVAIGGHSYGAFTVANLLAHSDLFRAGVARSGAYNRSLTPFGFQGEQRSFWDATDVYMTMSPFTHAAKIDEPILLIHGAEDSNSGTYPIQSERLYQAIRGLGGTVRWVVLPLEDHGYRSLEACEQVHYETVRWLDRYVKNAEPREQVAAGAGPKESQRKGAPK